MGEILGLLRLFKGMALSLRIHSGRQEAILPAPDGRL
jgi:hypothetical protein